MGVKVGYIDTVRTIFKNEGLFSLYRGALAAGTGSIIFRASGFSIFEFFSTMWKDNEMLKNKIPFSGGIELRTFCAGFMSGTFRAIMECPFEYAKVNRQVG